MTLLRGSILGFFVQSVSEEKGFWGLLALGGSGWREEAEGGARFSFAQ